MRIGTVTRLHEAYPYLTGYERNRGESNRVTITAHEITDHKYVCVCGSAVQGYPRASFKASKLSEIRVGRICIDRFAVTETDL